MTALTAIACGIALGTLMVVLGAWWRLRRVRPKQRTLAKPASGLKLPSFPLPPPPPQPMPVLTPAERAEGWVVKNMGGMQVKVLDVDARIPAPPVPTSADPWDDDEPTTFHTRGEP